MKLESLSPSLAMRMPDRRHTRRASWSFHPSVWMPSRDPIGFVIIMLLLRFRIPKGCNCASLS